MVDLSLPLDEATTTYPGDPRPRVRRHSTIEDDGFNLLELQLGSQTGTHVDAPYHFVEGSPRIDGLPLELFLGQAVVVDATGLTPRSPIDPAVFAPYADRLRACRIVLVHTGWDAHYGTPTWFDHPWLEAAAVEELLGWGVRTFLLDTLNLDETPDDDHPGLGYPAHHLVARAGGAIGENLANLGAIDWPDPWVSCLPLRLTDADGAPARAVAFELG